MKTEVILGDCLDILKTIPSSSIDLVYLDPPFFTGKNQELVSKDRSDHYKFSDIWIDSDEYAEFLYHRLEQMKRVMKLTASIFFHCDRNASHIARFLLDALFGKEMFQSEIIWEYRRWANSHKGLLPAHQNILFYAMSKDFKFNMIYTPYSPSTNIDQILQKRERDEHNKSVYARDEKGNTIFNNQKKGVPQTDVWDIPYLNPKAKERVGYPTQKPILLLEKIIQLVTDDGDVVLDPFCGSGTTLVAAQMLGRNCIGIDNSPDAIRITQERLKSPIKSRSYLMEMGRETYEQADKKALAYLSGLDMVPVQRNRGIDAFLNLGFVEGSIPIRVQRPNESLSEAADSLYKASQGKHAKLMVLVSIQKDLDLDLDIDISIPDMVVVDATSKAIMDVCIQRLGKAAAPQSIKPLFQDYTFQHSGVEIQLKLGES
jgi:site-specific DNA-methyltransferase (adenine-specific)